MIKRFLGALHVELRRGFFSLAFVIAALGTTTLLYISAIEELKQPLSVQCVYQMIISAKFGSTFMATLVMSVVPLGASFCADVGCQFLRPHCIRSGIGCYSAAKVVAVALSGGCATFLGYALFIASFAVRMPFVVAQYGLHEYFKSTQYSTALQGGHFFTYMLTIALLAFALSALFATLALFCSTFIPNLFVTLFSPVLLWYVIDYVLGKVFMGWFNYLYVYYIYRGTVFMDNCLFSVLYALLFTVVMCTVLGFFINKNVRRRLTHV